LALAGSGAAWAVAFRRRRALTDRTDSVPRL
jgi:hypothetical protein